MKYQEWQKKTGRFVAMTGDREEKLRERLPYFKEAHDRTEREVLPEARARRKRPQPASPSPSDVAEIVSYAAKNDRVNSIRITGGSTFSGEREHRHITGYLNAIAACGAKLAGEILLYITPPGDFAYIDEYFSLGADRIACSMAAPDVDYFRRVKDMLADLYSRYSLSPAGGCGLNVCIEKDIFRYPQAELYLSQAEYDFWQANERGADARKVLEIYKDRLHLFIPGEPDSEIPDLIPGIKPVAAYGHTPGHTAFLVESLQTKLLIWGDVTHATPVQMPHPEISMTFDSNPEQAAATRKKILEYVLKNKIRIAGAHIVMPAIGNVRAGKAEGEYEFIPLCTCEAI